MPSVRLSDEVLKKLRKNVSWNKHWLSRNKDWPEYTEEMSNSMQDDFNYGFQGYIHYWSSKCENKFDNDEIVNKEVIASLNKMADSLSVGKAFDSTSVSDLYNDVWIEFPKKTGTEKFVYTADGPEKSFFLRPIPAHDFLSEEVVTTEPYLKKRKFTNETFKIIFERIQIDVEVRFLSKPHSEGDAHLQTQWWFSPPKKPEPRETQRQKDE